MNVRSRFFSLDLNLTATVTVRGADVQMTWTGQPQRLQAISPDRAHLYMQERETAAQYHLQQEVETLWKRFNAYETALHGYGWWVHMGEGAIKRRFEVWKRLQSHYTDESD